MTNTTPAEARFYDVVKVGVHLYGITNGMVLSGQVPLPIEFGNSDTNQSLTAVYVQDSDDSSTPGVTFDWTIDDEGTNRIIGNWDTTSVTNGTYTITVGASLSGSEVLDYPVTVTVSNLVWFPDPWNVAGSAIYMGAQTVFTNGLWHMDFYDDQHTFLGYIDGPVSADGWCNVANSPGPGFSVGITDANGNQLPSTAYTVETTVKATSAANSPMANASKLVVVETNWNYAPTKSVTAYKQLSDYEDSLVYQEIQGTADYIWQKQTFFHPDSFDNQQGAYRLWGPPEWLNVLQKLGSSTSFYNRDFFYFGHGGPNALGYDASVGEGFTRSFVQQYLANNQYQGSGHWTQAHPYRYVFLDGCKTASGNWPQAFGIPKVEGLVNQDFLKRGLRPRAFMGWKSFKFVGLFQQGSPNGGPAYWNDNHSYWLTEFFKAWDAANPSTGQYDLPISRAIAIAGILPPGAPGAGSPNTAGQGMVVFGSKDMGCYTW